MTFHSVGMNYADWVWKHLSERADVFERLLQGLSRNGYKTISLQQLYSHMSGEQVCDPKSIVLVFDDGYLDNWVVVYPLLKKYGMQGTVYVNPEFVDPGNTVRPTLDDIEAADPESADVERRGFMNWLELSALDSSGILDVQSHSLTHTWHFVAPRVVDCYSPQTATQYPWLQWNAKPGRKPFYLNEDQSGFVSWGTPVLEHEKSIIARRFIPDEAVIAKITEEVNRNDGVDFFRSPNWKDRYDRIVSSATNNAEFPGEYESEEGCEKRVRWELSESKSIIEAKLDKEVHFLCWPGGGENDTAKRLALDVGYKSWTLPGGDSSGKRNIPNSDPSEIKRLPAMRDAYFFGRRWGVGSEMLMMLDVMAHQESFYYDSLRKAYKVGVSLGIAGDR